MTMAPLVSERVTNHAEYTVMTVNKIRYYTKTWISPSFIRVQSHFDMFRLSPAHRETFRIAALPLLPMVYMPDFPEDGQAQAETFQVCGRLKTNDLKVYSALFT
jgi:hypothetical protein